MPFRFPLESVLRVRLSAEEREEAALGSILREIAATREQVAASADELARVTDRRASQIHPQSAAELWAGYAHVAEMKRQRNEAEAAIERLEQRRDAQAETYRRARRDREMMESLRDGQEERYALSSRRAEQAMLDQFAAGRRRLRHGS